MRISRSSWRVVEAAAILLFWLQAVRTLFSMLFGVIYDALFDAQIPLTLVALIALAVIVAWAAPAAVAFLSRRSWFIAAVLAAAARIPMTLEDPQIRLVSSIAVIAAAGVYLAFLLHRRPQLAPPALVLALIADQVARAYGHTWDITLRPAFLPLQILLCLGVGALAVNLYTRPPQEAARMTSDRVGGLGFGGGIALGALLFLETAVLSLPNVLARWTGVSYQWTASLLVLVTALPLLPLGADRLEAYGGLPLDWLRARGVLVRAVLFGLVFGGLAVGRLGSGVPGLVALLVAQLALLAALPFLPRPSEDAGVRTTGPALAAGMLLFFALHLALTFTFTYPYTLPAFRDAGWAVLLAAAAIASLPAALRAPDHRVAQPVPLNLHLVVAALVITAAVFFWSDTGPAQPRRAGPTVRAATYNIHYGYDTHWRHTLEAQARAIEASGADIVFLQEVDAGRLTSYGVDNALWLGRRLGMTAVFAPALEGLSGVALLTRLPVADTGWWLLPSELEQTAMAHARILLPVGALDAYGLWLGLEEGERRRQIEAALAIIGDREPALLGGDMNAEPDSPVYQAVLEAGFVDPFVVTGNLPAYTDPAIDPHKRIDYVWARGLTPLEAEVSPSLASDHRLVVVEVALP